MPTEQENKNISLMLRGFNILGVILRNSDLKLMVIEDRTQLPTQRDHDFLVQGIEFLKQAGVTAELVIEGR